MKTLDEVKSIAAKMKSYNEVVLNFKTESPLPTWYNQNVHEGLLLMLIQKGTLYACKLLRDESNRNPHDNEMTLRICKDLCDFIQGRDSKEIEPKPVLEQVTMNEDDNLVIKVADLINDEIQDHYDLTGLCSLLRHVPESVLRDYLDNY